MKHKSELLKEIDRIKNSYRDLELLSFPGMYHTSHLTIKGEVVPAYMLSTRSRHGIPFIMPDFVGHNGLVKGDGFQKFSHDVIHLVQNNLNENVPRIKKCWSEFHRSGTENARKRNGELGQAGVLEGETVVLCAPGPSLSDQIDVIAEARKAGRVKVVSINRAVRAIESDYCIYIERFVPPEWRDEHVHKLQKDAKLILAFQSDYHLSEEWPEQDNLYWGYFNFGPFQADVRVNHLAMMDAMASTTLGTALRCVYEMGAKNILLAGADFACKADLVPVKMQLNPNLANELHEMLTAISVDVSKGNGKKDDVKQLADHALEMAEHREQYGWDSVWRPENFYYDVSFENSPYQGDPRFAQWKPVRSTGGHHVITTLEFMSYADQLRTVMAVIESSGVCKVANVSPYSALQWRYIEIDKAIPEAPDGNIE